MRLCRRPPPRPARARRPPARPAPARGPPGLQPGSTRPGAQHHGHAGRPDDLPLSPGGRCAGLKPVPGPGATITLHNSSNGGTFCVSIGQRVLVQLDSKPSRMWSPVRSDSRALVSLAYGDLMQRVGQTGAIFAAAHPGIAHLSSAQPAGVHWRAAALRRADGVPGHDHGRRHAGQSGALTSPSLRTSPGA